MKQILMIGMGGTIASELTDEGLSPKLTPEQLLRCVPQISRLCRVDCLELFNLDSTNVAPVHWTKAAEAIRDNYGRYDGFVISHGTDTMAYTAAALSYLVQGSAKPIILTGAQKPIHFDNTDSKINLADAFRCACADDLHGVHLVFNGQVILGTRARKTRSKSFQAFSSINYPYVATLLDGHLLQYLHQDAQSQPAFYSALDSNVGLIKLVPGVDYELLAFLLQRKDAVIIESFGVGGLPSYHDNEFLKLVKAGTEAGKFIVMTTQVQNEGSEIGVYHVGHALKAQHNVLEAYDMTTECVLAKIMWILGQTRDSAQVEALFYRPVANDILYRG